MCQNYTQEQILRSNHHLSETCSSSPNEYDLNIQMSDSMTTNLPQRVEGHGLITIYGLHPAVWWAGRDLLSPGGRSTLTLISLQSDRRELCSIKGKKIKASLYKQHNCSRIIYILYILSILNIDILSLNHNLVPTMYFKIYTVVQKFLIGTIFYVFIIGSSRLHLFD